ncbi:MAG: zinc-binding dehydrogenase, partial [Pseudomonadota bacterium]
MAQDMQALLLREGGFASTEGFVGNQLERPGDVLELGQVPRPRLKPGQILVQVRRAAVNPSDIAFVQGFYGQPRVAGAPAGFEGVGTVVEAGTGLMARALKGRDVGFYVTPDGSGSWGEYAVTQAALALPLKKGVEDRDAAGLIVNPVTAAAMLELVKPGEAFVFSAAASQLGKLVASLAKDQRKKMIALVRREAPMAGLTDLGARYVLNESEAGFDAALAELCKAQKPRIFIDAVAGPASAKVHRAMGKGARWVIYGKLDAALPEILDPGEMIFLGKVIEGFWTTEWARKTSFLRKMKVFNDVQNRFRGGRWTTDVSAELPMAHAIERLPQALAQPDGKV